MLGGFDGTASYLGIIVYLASTHPALIVPTALVGAIGSGISMGGGEWLSDSDNGFGASLVMAGATFLGALLPALPFALWHGPVAAAESVIICVCIGITVSLLRPKRGLGLALAETFGIMLAVLGVVLLLGLVLLGGVA